MIAKVILGTMTNARKLVSIAERISCDVELCSGRYVVNAKSMLGVLSMPEFEYGELHIHTDEENECNQVLERLLEEGLLADTNDAAKRSLYDITTFGEILIDFTWQGVNDHGCRFRHYLPRIRVALLQMLQLRWQNLVDIPLLSGRQERICMESF